METYGNKTEDIKNNKSPITFLDKINNEIIDEAINYCLDNTKQQQTNEDIISGLTQLLEEGEKKQKQYKEKYKKLSQEFSELDTNYTNDLNKLN